MHSKFFAEAYFTHTAGDPRELRQTVRMEKPTPILVATPEEAAEEAKVYFASLLTPGVEWDGKVFVYGEEEWRTHLKVIPR